jgi:hypothetical protein
MIAPKTVARAVVVATLTAAAMAGFAAENAKSGGASTNGVEAELSTTQTQVQLGDSIKVFLTVKNQGNRETMVDMSATAFDCFEVKGPDGQSAPYVGFIGQVASRPMSVQPSSSKSIAEGLDLTDKYVFEKPGRYSIRFRGEGMDVPTSNPITVEVTPGQLGELDQLVLRLLPLRPKGWSLTKSPRSQHEVAPFGQSRAPGYEAHICRNYMQGEAVYLWLTKAEAQPVPGQKPRITSEYLGRTGGLHVYVAEASKTPALWPKAIEDISRALQIVKE